MTPSVVLIAAGHLKELQILAKERDDIERGTVKYTAYCDAMRVKDNAELDDMLAVARLKQIVERQEVLRGLLASCGVTR